MIERVSALESVLKRPYTGSPILVRLSVWSDGKRQSAYSLIREGQEFSVSFVAKQPKQVTFTVGPYKLCLPVNRHIEEGCMWFGSHRLDNLVTVYARRP